VSGVIGTPDGAFDPGLIPAARKLQRKIKRIKARRRRPPIRRPARTHRGRPRGRRTRRTSSRSRAGPDDSGGEPPGLALEGGHPPGPTLEQFNTRLERLSPAARLEAFVRLPAQVQRQARDELAVESARWADEQRRGSGPR